MKKRIIKGSTELFFSHGIRSVTMDDIAHTLGISKKTLYLHFSDKDKLVQVSTAKHLEAELNMMTSIHKEAKDSIHEIMLIMKRMDELFRTLNPLLLSDMQKYHPNAWNHFRNFKNVTMMKMIEDNIRRGIKEGLYRKEVKLDILARLRVEEVEMAMRSDVYPTAKYDMRDVHLSLLDHFLHGITTLTGFKLIEKYKKAFSGPLL